MQNDRTTKADLRDFARRAKRRAQRARRRGEMAAGVRLFTRGGQPHGVDVFDDLDRTFPDYDPGFVFDVGANDGDATAECLAHFPDARLLAFEPVADNFGRLAARFADDDRVTCRHLALGAEPGTAMITTHESGVLSSLAEESLVASAAETAEEEVTVETVDRIAAAEKIEEIGFLKIDTEGYDLEVLRGAAGMLERQAIDFVEAEVSMSRSNRHHVHQDEVRNFLEPLGYELFGIYDQIPEWTLGRANLRRSNLVFCSRRIIDAHATGAPPGLLA